MKLLTAFPVYHQIPATFFTRYLGMNKTNVVGNIVVDSVYLPVAMNMIVNQALKVKTWDRLVIMEQDTLPPLDAFDRVDQYTQDIVGSMYFRHSPPHDATVYIQEENSLLHNPLTPQTVKDWSDKPGLYECSAVGLGFTSIARSVLENWDKDIPMFSADKSIVDFGSHDLWFCYQARQQGFKVYVDTGVQCDHLTEVGINLSDNQKNANLVADRPTIKFSIGNNNKNKKPVKSTKRK